jgi:hypothetical protein
VKKRKTCPFMEYYFQKHEPESERYLGILRWKKQSRRFISVVHASLSIGKSTICSCSLLIGKKTVKSNDISWRFLKSVIIIIFFGALRYFRHFFCQSFIGLCSCFLRNNSVLLCQLFSSLMFICSYVNNSKQKAVFWRDFSWHLVKKYNLKIKIFCENRTKIMTFHYKRISTGHYASPANQIARNFQAI